MNECYAMQSRILQLKTRTGSQAKKAVYNSTTKIEIIVWKSANVKGTPEVAININSTKKQSTHGTLSV